MERSSENDNRHLRPRDIAAAIVLSLMLTAAAYLSRTNPAAPEDRLPGRDVAVHAAKRGFTLIELSIVLVIIGLIVGGVLAGQDLVRAAGVRATISQIEKYNTAVNTFRGKYGALPGDLNAAAATQFGFPARGAIRGEGDGNGVIEGAPDSTAGDGRGIALGTGETVVFWVDLTVAGLIDGGFNTASCTVQPPDITGTTLSQYLPAAKIGQGNYVYVYSGGTWNGIWNSTGVNYYGISAVTSILATSSYGYLNSNPGVTVQQAFSIDKKIDDGLPKSGTVTAEYLNGNIHWMDGWDAVSSPPFINTGAIPASATSCYDNGNVNAALQQYSLSQNGGAGVNCALSFRFQ